MGSYPRCITYGLETKKPSRVISCLFTGTSTDKPGAKLLCPTTATISSLQNRTWRAHLGCKGRAHTCIHCSLLISTPLALRDVMALSMIFSTIWVLPLASSSLAAVIQMCRSVGIFSRALLRTLRAFSYVSSLASASHSCGATKDAFEMRTRRWQGCCMAVSAHRDKQLHTACYWLATVLKHCKQAVEFQWRRGETGCCCPWSSGLIISGCHHHLLGCYTPIFCSHHLSNSWIEHSGLMFQKRVAFRFTRLNMHLFSQLSRHHTWTQTWLSACSRHSCALPWLT